jgi:hypothetical protein
MRKNPFTLLRWVRSVKTTDNHKTLGDFKGLWIPSPIKVQSHFAIAYCKANRYNGVA